MIDEDFESGPDPYEVKFEPATTPEQFRVKAETVLSNALDVLNAKLRSGLAEASDIKSALEFGKHFKIGIDTVDAAAARRFQEEAEAFEDIEEEEDDYLRFQS